MDSTTEACLGGVASSQFDDLGGHTFDLGQVGGVPVGAGDEGIEDDEGGTKRLECREVAI
jgi:hypothetical protein